MSLYQTSDEVTMENACTDDSECTKDPRTLPPPLKEPCELMSEYS
jgi:hypothetical protein